MSSSRGTREPKRSSSSRGRLAQTPATACTSHAVGPVSGKARFGRAKSRKSRTFLDTGGRFVSVIRLGDGSLAAVDSICYHAGGSLGLGAIEDGNKIICPQHKYRVCLRTGAAFAGGDRAAEGRRQRVHVAYEVDGALRVRPSAGGALASDRFAGARETSWHDVMWREVRVARPVAAPSEGAAP